MLNATPLKLEKSEADVLAAASRIYAAHIVSGQVPPENAESIMEHSIQSAIAMASRVDRLVKSDGEMG
ncbi:MAG: hypothetical protein ACI9VS_001573 [Candidatus Binatia bacterium]|jgi:hypothetical protein